MTDGWQRFDDPDFDLRFDYPPTAASGEVQVHRHEVDGRRRAHALSEDGQEVYFELRQSREEAAEEALEDLRQDVMARFPDATFGSVEPAELMGADALALTFSFTDRVRRAVFAPFGEKLYAVVYDPRSEVNERILESLTQRRA